METPIFDTEFEKSRKFYVRNVKLLKSAQKLFIQMTRGKGTHNNKEPQTWEARGQDNQAPQTWEARGLMIIKHPKGNRTYYVHVIVFGQR